MNKYFDELTSVYDRMVMETKGDPSRVKFNLRYLVESQNSEHPVDIRMRELLQSISYKRMLKRLGRHR